MKKLGIFFLVLLTSATLAVGGWWLYSEVIRPLLEPAPLSLSDLDRALERKDWDKARELLAKSLSEVKNLAQSRRFLSRALKLAENNPQDWASYLNLAQKIRETFPGSAQGAFLLSYGYLRSGQPQEAVRLIPLLEALSEGPSDMDPQDLQSLIRELRLRTELDFKDRETDPALQNLTEALGDPRQTLTLYQGLQARVEDSGILQNTLLLHLREGRYNDVLRLLNDGRNGLRTPLLKALIYYDSAQWERSLEVLKTLEAMEGDLQYNLLLADVTMHLSGAEAAALVYRRMIREDPSQALEPVQVSPIPYLNLATLLEGKGGDLSLKESKRLLELMVMEGMDPLNNDMRSLSRLFSLELDFRLGGISAVSDKLLKSGLSPDEEILRYRLMPEYLSLPRLHLLFKNTAGPEYDRVAEALIWYLLLAQDYEKALDTIEKWESSAGASSWWSSYYRALLHGLMQDPRAAMEDFQDVPARWRDFGYFYNLGLVSWALDSPEGRESALKFWEEGRNALSGIGVRSLREKDVLFSKLYQRLAQAFEAAGDLNRAREYSSLATKLDETNHGAYFLEKRLSTDEDLINDEIEEPGAD